MDDCRTVAEVLDALGRNNEIQELFDPPLPANVVAMWRVRQRLPPRTYVVLRKHLKSKGHKAPATLWSMYRAARDSK